MKNVNITRALTGAKGVLRWLAAIGVGAVFAANVHAKNVLILSTGSVDTSVYDVDVLSNVALEFSTGNTVTTINTMNAANAISASTFGPGTYDLVVVVRFNTAYDPGNKAILDAAIENRWASGFALFYDTGGSGTSTAARDLQSTLQTAAGFTFSPSGPVTADANFQLNTNSPYAADFANVNPMRGGYFFYMNGVPATNALHLNPSVGLPAIGDTGLINNVYSVFIPATQSFGGKGACLVASADSSMFETRNYSDPNIRNGGDVNTVPVLNVGKIGPAFEKALAPGGACGIPASISKQFAPKTIGPGGISTLTIQINNAGGNAVSGLNVTDNLPAPLVIAGAVTQNTCTGGTLSAAVGAAVVSLTDATLPVGGCAISVPVRWPLANASECVAPGNTRTNTINPGSDFTTSQGQVATPATDTLTCDSALAAPANPVPTLGEWMLLLLTALLSGSAVIALRRTRVN